MKSYTKYFTTLDKSTLIQLHKLTIQVYSFEHGTEFVYIERNRTPNRYRRDHFLTISAISITIYIDGR